MSEMLEKKISYLISYKILYAFGWLVLSNNMMQNNQLLLAYFFQFYPDKTGRNWMTIGETLKDVRNAGQKIIVYLLSHKR